MKYHGGGTNFYSNRNEVYLPGWFAYYPIPGYRNIFDMDIYGVQANFLEKESMFDISVKSKCKIYSDLPRDENDTLKGKSMGVTLLGGLIREKEVDGITYIYSYLEKSQDPESFINEDVRKTMLQLLSTVSDEETLKNKKFIFVPNVNVFSEGNERVSDYGLITAENFETAINQYEFYINQGLQLDEGTEEYHIEKFKEMYYSAKISSPEGIPLDILRSMYDFELKDFGAKETSDEEFMAFLIKHLGQKELDYILGNE